MIIPKTKHGYFHKHPAAVFIFILISLFCMIPVRGAASRNRRSAWKFEKLDRGLAAMQTEGGIYLSWRIFNDEDPAFGTADELPHFTVFRDGMPIAELDGKTNFTDKEGTPDSVYQIRSVKGENESGVKAFSSGKNYFDIPLVRPEAAPEGPFTINDGSTGDLDGDGVYDLVIKWDCHGLDNTTDGMTGRTLLDAYSLDGTHLWEAPIDLGPNIRSGAHYTQFLVYDLDQDGKSEVICKTAPGSKDAAGNYVSQASLSEDIRAVDDLADLRNEDGQILTGDEFLTVFRGETGEAIDTIYYPNQRVSPDVWGDSNGNRSERYNAAIAWMDGQIPYAVFMRGYYLARNPRGRARQTASAVSFDGEKLHCRHSFDTFNVSSYRDKANSSSYTAEGVYKGVEGYWRGNEIYVGQGNHNCIAADVDRDGRDEVLTGALCYEFDARGHLVVKWSTFLGHGDAMHIGDYDPTHPGYEFFTIHESGEDNIYTGTVLDYGMTVLDPADGTILFHVGGSVDTGRGMMANIGIGGYYQIWATQGNDPLAEDHLLPAFTKTKDGFVQINVPERTSNFRIFWDGDLAEELLDGLIGEPLTVSSWNGSSMEPIFQTEGAVSINGTKANPCLQADILGDWREELIMAREDHEALRVFVSDIPSSYTMMTLMHDPVYRAGVASEQSANNQPPHVGFYPGGIYRK